MRDSYSISELCQALEVSRSAYFAAKKRPLSRRAQDNQQLLHQIHLIHAHRHTRCYGSPRMTRALQAMGTTCSENRVAKIMRSQGLRARMRKPFRPKTTTPDHRACPSPNLLAQAPAPSAPGQQLVSDITYIPTREGWLYLALIIDLYSRCILGWKLSTSLHAQLVMGALQCALHSRLLTKGAIFHSDRGCQFSAASTRQLLALHDLRQSMSAKGYCYDNAYAESTFASLKAELFLHDLPFETQAQARTAIFDYIESFYNRTRLHSSLGYRSPLSVLKDHFQKNQTSLN